MSSGYGNEGGKNYSYDACINWSEETKQEDNEVIKQEVEVKVKRQL